MGQDRIESIIREQIGLPPDQQPYFEQHRRRYADTLRLVPIPPAGSGEIPRLLEIGVLPGHLTPLARARGYEVTGVSNIDAPASFLKKVEKLGFQWVRADIESETLPLEDNHFDAVLFCEVLEHLYRNPFAALNEIFRVLKPGGRLILTTPNLAALGKLTGLLRGFSYRSALTEPRHIPFPPLLSYTHFREYTDRELVHLLRWQDKYPYVFRIDELRHSSCWDPGPADWRRKFAHPVRLAGSVALRTLTACVPHLRSSLMVAARKPTVAAVPPDRWTDLKGLGDAEHDEAPTDASRYALRAPFRWSGARAGFTFPRPDTPARTLRLCYGLMAPSELAPLNAPFSINGRPAHSLAVKPALELRCLNLPVPDEECRADTIRIDVETETWRPRDFGMADDRTLGLMFGLEPVQVFDDDLETPLRMERLGLPKANG